MNDTYGNFIKNIKYFSDEEKKVRIDFRELDYSIFKNSNKNIIAFDKIVNDGSQIAVRKHTRFINYPKHTHDYIELNFILSGSVTQLVDNGTIILQKGDLLFLNPGVEHEISYCDEDDIIINFIIHPAFFDSLFPFLNSADNLLNFIINTVFMKDSPVALLFKNLIDDKEIDSLINKIILEIKNNSSDTHHEAKIKLLIGLLFIELSNKQSIKISKTSYDDKIIIETLKYIEDNIQAASLAEISNILNIKNYNLAKLIKKHTNRTFKEILKESRLNKVSELLLTTDIPIFEISRTLGFSNTSFFHNEFNKRFGHSPKKYRNLFQNKS